MGLVAVDVAGATLTLERLVKELARRQADGSGSYRYGVETLSGAYDGEFKLRFASENFRDFFSARYQHFADNWCGIVADAPHERLEPVGIRLSGTEKGDADLWGSWLSNDADALCDLALLDSIVAKRSFAHVWGDDDDKPVISWLHPSQAIVGYDPRTRARVAGAHVWCDEDFEFAALDWQGFLWKFKRSRVAPLLEDAGFVLPSGAQGGWEPRQEDGDETWPIANPMGKNSFVELPNRPRLKGEPHSDIAGTLAMQHAINLFWAELFAVADESTIGQRVVIGAEQPMMPILNESGDIVGEKPVDLKKLRRDNLLWIEDDAKVEEWSPASLKVFTDAIEVMVGHIAAQTRTPAHYLLIGGDIANVSGDAMKALETGLVARTREKTQHFGRAIRDVFELVALADGDKGKAEAVRAGTVLWRDVENRSDSQLADALSKKKEIGYPLRYILELDGLPPHEIERVMAMVRDEESDPELARILGRAEAGAGDAGDGA